MVDATDLKSVGLLKARAGSSPAIGKPETRQDYQDSLDSDFFNRFNPVNPVQKKWKSHSSFR